MDKKISRNEKCPCNSGHKYKKCCGNNLPEQNNKLNFNNVQSDFCGKDELRAYISAQILKWKYFQEIQDGLNKNNNDYELVHIKTFPHNDLMFELAIPKPTFWTFAFIKLQKYKDTIFMLFSDNNMGVHKRLCKNNRYNITNNTPCLIGKNNLDYDEVISCIFDCDNNISYLEIDWFSGIPLHIIEDNKKFKS